MKELSTLLIEAHTPNESDILKKYHVERNDILRGVFCPGCRALPMVRIYGKWKCPHCGEVSKYAHIEALKDYNLLISDTLNNRQVRDFLRLDSIHIAKKLLQKEHLEQVGNTSARKYKLPYIMVKS